MSLILKKIVRKTNINGKTKMEFDIFKKNNKKVTEISGNINNTGTVKIRKFKQVPIIKGPNKFTLNINQIKDIMNIDKITPTKRSKSVKKEKNIVNVKRTKSVKKEKKIVKSKDAKHSKPVKKEKKVIKSKDSKHSKSVKKEKKVVKSKGSNINKKSIKNNLEK
jgi:hypothetical protein